VYSDDDLHTVSPMPRAIGCCITLHSSCHVSTISMCIANVLYTQFIIQDSHTVLGFLGLVTTTFLIFMFMCTVKRVDEVVRHPHLVTQDQNTQASNKVSDIPEENFTINIELFRQTFTNVELLR
jgi:hypothetical protein